MALLHGMSQNFDRMCADKNSNVEELEIIELFGTDTGFRNGADG